MPPQKNSGNRGSKKADNVHAKNKRFIGALLDDIRSGEDTNDVYIARIIRKMGNGRVEVFFIDSMNQTQIKQALIRGSFRGKGKRAVWIEVGTIVIVADSGISGSAEFEIMAVLSQDDIQSIRKDMEIDPRILAIDVTDTDALKNSKSGVGEGYVFENEDSEETEDEVETVKKEERKKISSKPELDDFDIDDI
jgi:hypothetical protein